MIEDVIFKLITHAIIMYINIVKVIVNIWHITNEPDTLVVSLIHKLVKSPIFCLFINLYLKVQMLSQDFLPMCPIVSLYPRQIPYLYNHEYYLKCKNT